MLWKIFETFRLWNVIGIISTDLSEGVFTYQLEGENFCWRWSKGVAVKCEAIWQVARRFLLGPLGSIFFEIFFGGTGLEM